jgi:signal transduction histidine kinase
VLNALRAMPGGGWVEISGQTMYRGEAVSAAISVSDTGPGFAQESANRIFEPGFSTRPGSPGLGLAVCRKIAEQHGGTLVASNRARAGANFTMTFPLEQEAVRGKSDEVAG